MIEFKVEGRPVPAQRMTQRGKFVKKNAQRYLAYKSMVKLIAQSYMSRNRMAPLLEQVEVDIEFYYQIPKSYSRRQREAIETGGGKFRPRSQGDIDNLVKSITDACNGVCYRDDIQISEIKAKKLYGETDHVIVRIKPINEV